MAKVAFSKLNIKPNTEIIITDYNGCSFEVKQYLPLRERIELISNVVNNSVDENNFYNPLKITMHLTLEFVYFYTNLSFTAKQKEDEFKLYDTLVSSGLFNHIVTVVGTHQLTAIKADIECIIKNIYDYKNSAIGILDTVTNDYGELKLDMTEISSKLTDPNNLELLRNIMTKLG